LAVKKDTGTISWGEPARIAESKEHFTCGCCGAKRGFYGKHFGIGPSGQPLPVINDSAFDCTVFSNSIAAKCWHCDFAFYQILSPEPDEAPEPPKTKKKRRRSKRKRSK